MSEEKRYNLMQLDTTGWNIINNQDDVNLTREECDVRIKYYLDQGIAPERLKASRYIP
tara:strand:+ start:435 stop:608 length:174 start_codon:yes stop_codon:yes gene_type:complete